MNKIISYCFFLPEVMAKNRKLWDSLYQDKERYWYNLPAIFVLDSIFYPEYVKRFYITESVLDHKLGELFLEIQKINNFEIRVVSDDKYKFREFTTERFGPLWEDCDIVIFRDVDSVVTGGEWQCNRVFEESPAHAYSARSHRAHDLLMGGLCGFKPKLIRDKTEDSLESFVEKYAPGTEKTRWDLDQHLLNAAFAGDPEFTQNRYYDMPIHNARGKPRFPCKKIIHISDIQSNKIDGDRAKCIQIIEKYVKPRWAGMPVDLRGGATSEILEHNTEIRDIVHSSNTLLEFYHIPFSPSVMQMSKVPSSWFVPRIYRNPNSHKGDTSRELIDMWDEAGYCKIIDSDSRLSWWGNEEEVLLYEFNNEKIARIPPKENVKLGLFGNYKPSDWGVHWIFWARHPRILENRIKDGLLQYADRDISSVFIGNIVSNEQRGRRLGQDWSKCVELFSLISGGKYKYTQEEYLNTMARSKFGLCLAGYGQKCNREPECMGLGVVPIVAPEVDMKYYDSPEEGVHYFRANSPEEVKEIIEGLSESEWKQMSDHCIDWWHRNCSRGGSFNTTQRIIEENYYV